MRNRGQAASQDPLLAEEMLSHAGRPVVQDSRAYQVLCLEISFRAGGYL